MKTLPKHDESCSFPHYNMHNNEYFCFRVSPVYLVSPAFSLALSFLCLYFEWEEAPILSYSRTGGVWYLWEVEASDISTKLQPGKNKWLSFSGCKFLLRHVVHFTVQRRTQVVIHSYEYMNTNKIIQLKTSDIYSLTLILNKKSLFLCFFLYFGA